MARPINPDPCQVEGCGKSHWAKGYCRQHWHRLKTYGRLEKIIGLIKGNCVIEGCDKKIKGHGYCVNHWTILNTYKIKPEEYYEKLKFQNYVCAICKEPETSLFKNTPGKVKKLSIDHCHNTGKIRDLLCQRCNHFLGRVDENVLLIQEMINYINKHKEK
jgi:hypothetical protein